MPRLVRSTPVDVGRRVVRTPSGGRLQWHAMRGTGHVRAALAVLSMAFALVACTSDGDGSANGDDAAAPTTTIGGTTTTTGVPQLDGDVALPIVFVHGFAGSAQQFESQALRFVANGWPAERIVTWDHDGSGVDIPAYTAGLVEVVDDTLERFGVDRVYLIGHSRGTFVSSEYLSVPANAAKVAKYVALDGRPCVEVVPCLEVRKEDLDQGHVEAATSVESFVRQWRFLVGGDPATTSIEPEDGPIEVSGRVVNFPFNTGRDGATVNVWELDSNTGHRVADAPEHTFTLDTSGDFGPIELQPGVHYEFEISAPDGTLVHHVYQQPYLRSTRWARVLTSTADGTTRVNTNTSDDHTTLIAMRMREWWTTGPNADRLTVSVDGGEPVDALAGFMENGAIGIHVHDDAATPRESTMRPLEFFASQPFQSGIDLFLPATPDGSGTISVVNLPRGDASRPQTINVPRWPSSGHAVSVVFADWPMDGGY